MILIEMDLAITWDLGISGSWSGAELAGPSLADPGNAF